MKPLSRSQVQGRVSALYADPRALSDALPPPELPAAVRGWLARLKLLYGVPIQYLVPDEGMLPPESIRFFYLDDNWVDALVDGAFSLGRTLTVDAETASLGLDRAVAPAVDAQSDDASAGIRAAGLGVPAPGVSFQTVAGFLLRSAVVAAYPGLGVNAYPRGGTPADGETVLLDILRLERLGPRSDTLLCLVAGDPVQVDVHEAPEALHYGIDRYEAPGGGAPTEATKRIRRFSRDPDGTITMSHTQVELDLVAGGAFRATAPRTLKMQTVAAMIAAAQSPPLTAIDSAVVGFEMTEGVGTVSFLQRGTEPR
jgi:hypothetical protein